MKLALIALLLAGCADYQPDADASNRFMAGLAMLSTMNANRTYVPPPVLPMRTTCVRYAGGLSCVSN